MVNILDHENLVTYTVNKLCAKNKAIACHRQDLMQEGFIGLIEATKTFDETKAAFSTYAMFWVRKRVLAYLDKKIPLIKGPQKQTGQEQKSGVLGWVSVVQRTNSKKAKEEQFMDVLETLPSPVSDSVSFDWVFESKILDKEEEELLVDILNDRTQEQIGSRLGCTKQNVSHNLLPNLYRKIQKRSKGCMGKEGTK